MTAKTITVVPAALVIQGASGAGVGAGVGSAEGVRVETLMTTWVNVVGATKALVSTTTGNPRYPRSVRVWVAG